MKFQAIQRYYGGLPLWNLGYAGTLGITLEFQGLPIIIAITKDHCYFYLDITIDYLCSPLIAIDFQGLPLYLWTPRDRQHTDTAVGMRCLPSRR